MQQLPNDSPKQSLLLKDRATLTLDGVEDVLGFDEAAITCRTTLGELLIEGSSLHIAAFSAESGQLCVVGSICSLCYAEKREGKSGGLFRRLLK